MPTYLSTSLDSVLSSGHGVVIRQKKELIELIGIESRNKYAIETTSGEILAYAAEQGKSLFARLFRQILGHWRTYEIHIFDPQRKLLFLARHPFRFFFQRLEVSNAAGQRLGAIQQRLAFITKKFDVEDARGNVLLTVSSPLWRIWTFKFMRGNSTVAQITKEWSGLLKEAFTDADNFVIDWNDSKLSANERTLILAAGIFVDLAYFEHQADVQK